MILNHEEKRIEIDPKRECQNLGLVVIDPADEAQAKEVFCDAFQNLRVCDVNDFLDTQETMAGWGWLLYSSMDQVHEAAKDDSPGLIELDLEKDPDPFGNHGISILDRLAAMGWPADRMLIQDRREQVRPEDLL